MKVLATIEARMGSTRLPGKVMLPFGGLSMLERKIERVLQSELVDAVKVLSTDDPMNQVIEDLCRRIGCPIFRGSEDDITDRIIKGTAEENPDIIVQLTGDNPLIDSYFIDETVECLTDGQLDLASNSLTQNTIIGMNVRCFTREALLRAGKACDDPMVRIHGGYYIQINPDNFKVGECAVDKKYYADDVRLTVDEPADYELCRRVFEVLYPIKHNFSVDDILDLFKKYPEWKAINKNVRQKKPGDG